VAVFNQTITVEKGYEEAKSFIEQRNIFAFDRQSATKSSEKGAQLNRLGTGIEIRDLFNASICVTQDIPIPTRKAKITISAWRASSC